MLVALSSAGMRRLKAWAAHRSRHDDNQLRKAKRSARQKCLRLSCECATASCSAGFLGDAGCGQAPFLCARENVPPANARIVAPPPMADEQSYNQQTVRPLL